MSARPPRRTRGRALAWLWLGLFLFAQGASLHSHGQHLQTLAALCVGGTVSSELGRADPSRSDGLPSLGGGADRDAWATALAAACPLCAGSPGATPSFRSVGLRQDLSHVHQTSSQIVSAERRTPWRRGARAPPVRDLRRASA